MIIYNQNTKRTNAAIEENERLKKSEFQLKQQLQANSMRIFYLDKKVHDLTELLNSINAENLRL